jgi:hypothetical protein
MQSFYFLSRLYSFLIMENIISIIKIFPFLFALGGTSPEDRRRCVCIINFYFIYIDSSL